MSPRSSVEAAALAGVTCNVALYGSYLILFSICMFFLIRSRLKGIAVHWILFLAITIQFILSTLYISAQLYMMFQSFVGLQSASSIPSLPSQAPTPSGPQSIVPEPSPTWWRDTPTTTLATHISELAVPSVSGWGNGQQEWSPIALYWLDKTSIMQIFSNITCFSNVVIGDTLLIWRVYVVWGKQWIFCVPSLISLTAALVVGVITITKMSTISYSDTSALSEAVWSLSLGTQIMSTLLISFRIWRAGHSPALRARVSQHGTLNNPYKKLLWIIVESGAIYSAMALALLIFYLARQMDAAMVLMSCTGQVSAIIPAFIVILVHLNLMPAPKHSNGGSNMINDHRIIFASYGSRSSHNAEQVDVESSVKDVGVP